MKRVIILLTTALSAAASALDLGVGVFYAPGWVVAPANGVPGLPAQGGKKLSPAGFRGRFTVSLYKDIDVAFGLGYNDFVYREYVWEEGIIGSIPMLVITFGVDYAFRAGAFRPFVGGGAAIVQEYAQSHSGTLGGGLYPSAVDWYGGLYVEGGGRYYFTENWAVEAAPRYTLLFDNPVVAQHNEFFDRSDKHTQLMEFQIGVNYYF
ncbi:MAG: hypothetical protein GTN49_06035 [candidate division Zixibacteria bacterium]|nr:hypothetical protein [candidate division Zixibacteria bacterium]